MNFEQSATRHERTVRRTGLLPMFRAHRQIFQFTLRLSCKHTTYINTSTTDTNVKTSKAITHHSASPPASSSGSTLSSNSKLQSSALNQQKSHNKPLMEKRTFRRRRPRLLRLFLHPILLLIRRGSSFLTLRRRRWGWKSMSRRHMRVPGRWTIRYSSPIWDVVWAVHRRMGWRWRQVGISISGDETRGSAFGGLVGYVNREHS